jgi:hypothetical protein
MSVRATDGDVINIRRFHAHYRLAADHPDPAFVRQQLDNLANTVLPETLASLTASLGSEDGVVLIRRLEVNLALNISLDKGNLARQWAKRIVRELLIALHTEKGNGIARFPSRAAFVARFLADLAQGEAWGKWYYRQFDGLRMLPVSAALRTAVCDPDNAGAETLLRLPERDLVRVLQTLTVQDARRVLTYLAGQDSGSVNPDACLRILLPLLEQRPDLALPAEDIAGALRLYIEIYRETPHLAGPLSMNLALATVRFARYLAEHPPAQGSALINVITGGDRIALFRRLGAEAEHWLPLFEASAAHIEALGQLFVKRGHVVVTPPARIPGEAPRYTRFGGLFLLLPLLDDLPVSEITKDWPATETTNPAALLRLLLLLKCLGRSRTASAFFDPVMRDFLDIAPTVTPTMLANWQGSLSESQRETGLHCFRHWQYSVGIAGAETLVLAHVPSSDGPLALLQDCAGAWLDALEFQPNSLQSLAQRVRARIPSTAARLLADPAFAGALAASDKDIEVWSLDDGRISGLAQEPQNVAETLARLDRLENELAYLALAKPFCGPRLADLGFSLMAQGLLRAFARRLPGFARSTLPYLYDNFLDFGATVEAEKDRYLVRLERPPLHIVLNMTGMSRNRYRLSWLDGRIVELYQEG